MNYDISGLTTSTTSTLNLESIFAAFAAFGLTILIIGLVLNLISLIAMWKIYVKCGKPGWASIVPIYNGWVLFEIVDLPGWLILLPVANAIGGLIALFRLSRKFGKGIGFGLGLLFLNIIFICILAFGKDMPVEEETQENSGPDLMANDPNENGQINLMTPDPVATMLTENVSVSVPEMTEQPSLESQIEIPNNNLIITPSETNIESTESSAFDMPVPDANNQVINQIGGEIKQEPFSAPIATIATPIPSVIETPNTETEIFGNEDIAPFSDESINQTTVNDNQAPVNNVGVGTKKCINCGTKNPATALICSHCGQIL